MLDRSPNEPKPRPNVSRRRLLELGGLGAINLLWSDWVRAGADEGKGRAKSVILVFNCGAPSHLDLWDMKPDASDTVRGLFNPIATNVPGIQVSEILPRLARQADRLAIVRTLHHTHGGHNSGMYWSIVGRPYRIDSTLINPGRTDFPSVGTLVGWLAQRDGYSGSVPPYVITPAPHCDSTVYLTPGQFGACLGPQFDPFVLGSDPNAADFKVPNVGMPDGVTAQRLDERRAILGQLERRSVPPHSPAASDFDLNHTKAFSLISAGQMERAFDLSREPTAVRERYGRHSWGQSHLLARRLIEAGSRFVTTVNGPSIVWDTHADNFGRLKNGLVPPMEQAFAALLDDLAERGLLDSTLVVWMGDFGRTPIINKAAGRDHWPQCYSMVLAGGGIRGGQVVGESDRTGSAPKSRPVTPADVHATIFTALGYDPHIITYPSAVGVPTPLSEGEPIHEIL
jgi:hypothetical protein